MKTRFILGSALAAVLLMWGGTGKVMAQKNIDKMAAELADAQDLKSCGTNLPYRFDSGLRH